MMTPKVILINIHDVLNIALFHRTSKYIKDPLIKELVEQIIKSYPHGSYEVQCHEILENHILHKVYSDMTGHDMEIISMDIENIRNVVDRYLDTFFHGQEENYMFHHFLDSQTAVYFNSELDTRLED